MQVDQNACVIMTSRCQTGRKNTIHLVVKNSKIHLDISRMQHHPPIKFDEKIQSRKCIVITKHTHAHAHTVVEEIHITRAGFHLTSRYVWRVLARYTAQPMLEWIQRNEEIPSLSPHCRQLFGVPMTWQQILNTFANNKEIRNETLFHHQLSVLIRWRSTTVRLQSLAVQYTKVRRFPPNSSFD